MCVTIGALVIIDLDFMPASCLSHCRITFLNVTAVADPGWGGKEAMPPPRPVKIIIKIWLPILFTTIGAPALNFR